MPTNLACLRRPSNRTTGMRCLACLLLALASPGAAQFTPYAVRSEFLLAPPGVAPNGLLGFVNPAVIASLPTAETRFTWATSIDNRATASDWGLFSAVPHLGFGLLHRQRPGLGGLTEMRLAVGAGDDNLAVGLGLGWSRSRRFTPPGEGVAGVLARPSRRLSLASTWTQQSRGNAYELATDVGLRPFNDDRLTLFVEGARASDGAGGDRFWGIGANLHAAEGLFLNARWLDGDGISMGLRLEFGRSGVQSQGRSADNNGGNRRFFTLRLGPHRGDVLTKARRPRFVELNLAEPVRHRVFPLFDTGQPFLALMENLQRLRNDPHVIGVAVNLSGLRIDPELSWELRQQLQVLRASGRRIVVFIDRVGLRRYHLASVADRIVLDPYGVVGLEGLVAGNVYLAGALERLGIGTQQWRVGEFKSAFESLRRQDMSAPDRQQLQALLDDGYASLRHDITTSRNLSADAFDHLVDHYGVLTAEQALREGLVDTLGRWELVKEIVADLGATGGLIDMRSVATAVDADWGRPPTVAVAYALGICELDSGIRARDLAQRLRQLADDDAVDAVVLRVDSPGGDVLASDWVADAMAACHQKKPIIVSQGRLAASGGYWISLESDAIVTSPHTITGSIGVIAGWLYDDGLKAKLGVTTDHVQVGDHADLGFGLPLPLVGMALPDRPLSDDEAARVDTAIHHIYTRFVQRIAASRGHSPARIDSLARGRVWSGSAAVRHGLADTLGTLTTAIDMALRRSGADRTRPVRILETPRLGWLPPQRSGMLGWALDARATRVESPVTWSLLQTWIDIRARHNGEPLLLLPETLIDASN